MPPKMGDLSGRRFGRLIVLRESDPSTPMPSGKRDRRWLCKCDCGKEKIVRQENLIAGRTISCGCYASELLPTLPSHRQLYDGTDISLLIRKSGNRSNASGVRGVYYEQSIKMWRAEIKIRGKKYRRAFATFDEAIQGRQELFDQYAAPLIDEYERMKNEESPEREKL